MSARSFTNKSLLILTQIPDTGLRCGKLLVVMLDYSVIIGRIAFPTVLLSRSGLI